MKRFICLLLVVSMLIGCNPKQKVLTNLIQDKKPVSVVEVKTPPIDWDKMREQNLPEWNEPQGCQTRDEYEEEKIKERDSYQRAYVRVVLATAYYGYWFWKLYKLAVGFINQELEFEALDDEIAQAQPTDYKIVPYTSPSVYNPEIRVNLPIIDAEALLSLTPRIYIAMITCSTQIC